MLGLILLLISQLFAGADVVTDYLVTNTNDSGTGSLRHALAAAAADAEAKSSPKMAAMAPVPTGVAELSLRIENMLRASGWPTKP